MKNADGTQPKISLWLLPPPYLPAILKAVPLFLAGWTLISILHGLSWGALRPWSTPICLTLWLKPSQAIRD